MRPFRTVFIVLLVTAFVGCNSGKTLNESTGKEFLQQAISSAHGHRDGLFTTENGALWGILGDLTENWMRGRELAEDLSQATVPDHHPGTNEIKHLFDAQFVILTASTRSYSLARDWTGNTQVNPSLSFPLEMHWTVNPTTTDVNGRWSEIQSGMVFPGTLGGFLVPDKLFLFWSTNQNDRGYYNAYHPKQFRVNLPISGPLKHIGYQLGDGTTLTLDGTNIQNLQIKVCKYEWAPKIQPFFNASTGLYKIGTININEISDLLLGGSEAQAKASFTWSLVPNELGSALVGTRLGIVSATRRGSVEYNKKPDGTWVVTRFSLM